MTLKGTLVLYADLVFSYPRASFIVIDDYGTRAVVIAEKLDWSMRVGTKIQEYYNLIK